MVSPSLRSPPRSVTEHAGACKGARALVTAQPSPAPALQRGFCCLSPAPPPTLLAGSPELEVMPGPSRPPLWAPLAPSALRPRSFFWWRICPGLGFLSLSFIHRRSPFLSPVTALCRGRPANPPGQALPAGSRLLHCSVLPRPHAPLWPSSPASVGDSSGHVAGPPDARRPVHGTPRSPPASHLLCHLHFDGSNVSRTKPAPPALSQVSSFVHDISSSAPSPRALHSCSSISSS